MIPKNFFTANSGIGMIVGLLRTAPNASVNPIVMTNDNIYIYII